MLLLLFFVALSSAQWTNLMNSFIWLDSTTMTEDSGYTGIIYSNGPTPLKQIFTFAQGLGMVVGFNVNSATTSTTLTYAVVLRSGTYKPDVPTFAEIATAVDNGTAAANVTVAISTTTNSSGGAFTIAQGTYLVGSVDSFGNTFIQDDPVYFDWCLYMPSALANQNLTINANAASPTFLMTK